MMSDPFKDKETPSGADPPSAVSVPTSTMKANGPRDSNSGSPDRSDDESLRTIELELQEAVEMDNSRGGAQAVYVIAHPHGFYKIGVSQHPMRRLQEIQEFNPHKLELMGFEGFKNSALAETILHEHFSEYKVHSEWFDIPDEIMSMLFDERCEYSFQTIVTGRDEYPGLSDGQ